MRSLAVVTLLIMLWSASSSIAGARGGSRISLEHLRPAREVPERFLGLSYEVASLHTSFFDPARAELVQLLKNLGPGMFRFGGNSVEKTIWKPAQEQFDGCPANTVLEPEDIERIVSFSREVDWKLIVGLELGSCVRPKALAQEAQTLVQLGGDRLIGLEIGNEPDVYMKQNGHHGLRPPEWDIDQFIPEFNQYRDEIVKLVPEAPLSGPETCSRKALNWFPKFLSAEAGRLSFASHHYYPMDARKRPGKPNSPSLQNLLSQHVMDDYVSLVRDLVRVSRASGLQLRLSEGNSVSSGGFHGVSDTYAASLWLLDFLFTSVREGLVGVNLHTGLKKSAYAPVKLDDKGRVIATPLYYGLLLFHQAAKGRLMRAASSIAAGDSLKAYVTADGHEVRLLLINKNDGRDRDVRVDLPRGSRVSRILKLNGPSPDATDGATLGGTAVDPAGRWQPGADAPPVVAQGVMRVGVPRLSAMLVEITR